MCLRMSPFHSDQHKLFIRSILIDPSIKRILGKPMKGHILLKALLTAAQNDFRISNIGELLLLQHVPWEQSTLKNRGDVCNTC